MKRLNWMVLAVVVFSVPGRAQDLERQLRSTASDVLEARVRLRGDARRGAIVFHKSAAGCVKCHTTGDAPSPLGPNLSTIGRETTVAHIVESLLDPSKKIREGYETVSVLLNNGSVQTGMIVRQDDQQLVLRDAANLLQEVTIAKTDIDEISRSQTSMMPIGLVASIPDVHQFYDLVRYVSEVATGGPSRAAELQPTAAELVVKDDTIGLDHAGILRSLNEEDFKAGRQIYMGHCVNCHGADGNTPRLPSARAFGVQPLRFGADPFRMFMTVSRGAGLMAPLSHLSPKERYQVIHFVREGLMKDRNPDYVQVEDAWLDRLPKGTNRGDQIDMKPRDYGPVLASQLGQDVNNGLTFRLPMNTTVCYDLHRMRIAAAWQGGFLDLSETHHYRQRGERMPQIDGQPLPGLAEWQWAFGGSFELPDDAKPARGPVRSDWLRYHGHYLHRDRAILSYGIEGRNLLETIALAPGETQTALIHTLQVEPGRNELLVSAGRMKSQKNVAGVLVTDTFDVTSFKNAGHQGMAFVSGQPFDRDVPMPNANRPRHVIEGATAQKLDLGTPGRTVVVRFKAFEGTLIASTPAEGVWKPNGKSLFIRGGRLVYDIGWVGAMTSRSSVADDQWHVAVLTVSDNQTRLYIDGKPEAERDEFRRDPVNSFVMKIGATATNFGGDLRGDVEWIRIYDQLMTDDQVAALAASVTPPEEDALLSWQPDPTGFETPAPQVAPPNGPDWGMLSVAAVLDDADGCRWQTDAAGRLILKIPASDRQRTIRVVRCTLKRAADVSEFRDLVRRIEGGAAMDLKSMTRGGPLRWPEVPELPGRTGSSVNGYALDTIPIPFENPWNAWMRTSALDFFPDGRCVVTTHGGDVWIVSGIDRDLNKVTWKRFTAGLFEPFGVRVVDNQIYVTCRDGIKRLHDFNGDDEADFIEAFWVDDDVSSSFHAYNFDLQTDAAGNFYFAKAGQYTQHHRPGTIMRVPPEGGYADVIAWGLRTPNGMGRLPGDRFTVSDNQGPWMPAGKISLIRPGSFLGNMPINKEQDEWLRARHGGELPTTFDEPIVWTPQELDNSCGGQVWVDDARFGPLSGRMFHSSFGKGWLYTMSLQEVNGLMQGALVTLPHQWDAGVMRLRVNPADGQLYGTGLSGWQGPRDGLDGCLQRLRYTGDTVQAIDRIQVVPDGLEVTLTFDVAPDSVSQPNGVSAEMWNYQWASRYGSDQYSVKNPEERHHDVLHIEEVKMLDQRRLRLVIPDLSVCDQMQLDMMLRDADGQLFTEQAFLTIHQIPSN
ncbi:MAG: c-type cytochrome [Planctomycetaceae bacterium]|nr:c-type cytochrome [Planctomycetaceae bacterium]